MTSLNDDDSDISPLIDCKYMDIVDFKSIKHENNNFSIIHLNIHLLQNHKEEFETFLSMLNIKFDVIGLCETKLQQDIVPNYNPELKGYKLFSTPSEGEKGGTSLYISSKYDSIQRKGLEKIMYKSHLLESSFAEIIFPNKKNVLIGCVYRHPSMDLTLFNDKHLNPLLEILNSKKHIFLLGDMNIDLIKNELHSETSNFLDIISSNLFVPHIIHPTRITSHSKTLIDNIFSNVTNFAQGKSGNITLSLSDHLAQFLLIPLDIKFIPKQMHTFKQDFSNFDRENFILDLLSVDFKKEMELENRDPNHSFNKFISLVDSLISKYIPVRRISKKEAKNQNTPWINETIQADIRNREKLYKK